MVRQRVTERVIVKFTATDSLKGNKRKLKLSLNISMKIKKTL